MQRDRREYYIQHKEKMKAQAKVWKAALRERDKIMRDDEEYKMTDEERALFNKRLDEFFKVQAVYTMEGT
jgi:hypothetical protein